MKLFVAIVSILLLADAVHAAPARRVRGVRSLQDEEEVEGPPAGKGKGGDKKGAKGGGGGAAKKGPKTGLNAAGQLRSNTCTFATEYNASEELCNAADIFSDSFQGCKWCGTEEDGTEKKKNQCKALKLDDEGNTIDPCEWYTTGAPETPVTPPEPEAPAA
mmetsp:Transcript_44149/g.65473  ORF Transcript_44149/g.65473 Transcript_44149/m.65473 type:complete len:161 (-) Transcript_44149:103-585(-)|eukprot:CAMPEP_0194032098 /NCGR_PEP_ID=MMETSP0009_2-20130614/5116_1 /TAXON_ID=210454 /ORGANISM="Grammatophora oceanica, Strain CCMP 410" /LENGTH=160 /DNA_ID=CAMNT_0038672439 /DNA_START=113 /DNA_END=595 /DNA_ORIENTATION=+